MPQRYSPDQAAPPAPDQYRQLATKAARRGGRTPGPSARSSQASSEKRRGRDSDDNYDLDASVPGKKRKLEDEDALGNVNLDDMQDLETIKAYLNDALLFINNLGVASRAPANLRPLLMARSEAASSMAASIRKKISQASSRLQDAMYAYKDTGTTSDDFSKAMMEFLPGIRGLMEFKDPDSLRLSYDLVVKLSGSSYGYLDMPDSCGYGDRPSDEPADLLLTKLIRKRLAGGEIWDWKGDLEGLDRTSKLLEEYGIEPWYSRSRQALREQVADAGQ